MNLMATIFPMTILPLVTNVIHLVTVTATIFLGMGLNALLYVGMDLLEWMNNVMTKMTITMMGAHLFA